MASDDAYASFLDQANQPTSTSTPTAHATTAKRTSTATVPQPLQDLSAQTIIYQSDADSAFEALALKIPPTVERTGEGALDKSVVEAALREAGWSGATDVEEMSVAEWDPKGMYADVVSGVAGVVKAGKDGVRVFRVEGKAARVEYFVLGITQAGGEIVGAWVEAVES